MQFRRLTGWGLSLGLLLLGTSTSYASVDCTGGGAGTLNTALIGASGTLTITGTCTSNGSPFVVTTNGLTLDGGGSAIIKDQIVVKAEGVTIQNLIVNGSAAASGANTAIVIYPNNSANLISLNINTWSGDGVDLFPGARASILGGTIDTGNSTGNAVSLTSGASASIGYSSVLGTQSAVTITGNGTGVLADRGSAVLINLPDIFSNHVAGISIQHNSAATIVGGTIGSNAGDGIDIADGASVVFNSGLFGGSTATTVVSNTNAGISMFGGSLDIDVASIGITGGGSAANGGDGIDANQGASISIQGGSISDNSGGGINLSNATAKLRNLTINGNQGGPAIEAILSSVDAKTVTIGTPGTLGAPAILAYRTGIELTAATVNGPNNSNTLGVFGGASALLYTTTLTSNDATDPTVDITDGSSVVSAGGNTISNAASSGTVITVANGSTFIEESNPVLKHAFTPAADTITGGGTVQMQSNMELGTGGSVPSSWSGSITVAQNSSYRMHGGMTITGGVSISQGSNGFFNKADTGSNTISGSPGTVTCGGTGSSHVVGQAAVTPNIVITVSGIGCYGF